MATNSADGIRWDLSDLFSSRDDPRMNAVLDDCLKRAESFSALFRGTISRPGGPAPEHLLRTLKELEGIEERLSRVFTYSGLLYAAISSRPECQDFEERVEQRALTKLTSDHLF